MKQLSGSTSKITHDTVHLTTKAVHLAKRYGKRMPDGAITLNMTHRAFGIAFEKVRDLAEAVEICEDAFTRVRFDVSPACVTIVCR